jgi:CDP-diacylglycerol--glycerol-3-phosphate 3-phosphatidyltransferase
MSTDVGTQKPPEHSEDHHDELRFNTVPNRLTLLRVAFVPFVIALLYLGKPVWDLVAALTFGVAAATDYFDGYIARSRKVVTVYGKLMDPLADKFLVVCSLLMLQHLDRIHPIVVMLLVCRELAITGLRALASAEGVIISASGGGKLKTISQMIAIPFLMVPQGVFGLPLFPVGQALLYFSLAISLWSAKDYAIDFFKAIAEQRKQKAGERKIARQARHAARAARLAEKAMRKPRI